MLIGAADALEGGRSVDWGVEIMEAAHATQREAAGDPHFAELVSRGAALEIPDTVAYLRAEAEPLLVTDEGSA